MKIYVFAASLALTCAIILIAGSNTVDASPIEAFSGTEDVDLVALNDQAFSERAIRKARSNPDSLRIDDPAGAVAGSSGSVRSPIAATLDGGAGAVAGGAGSSYKDRVRSPNSDASRLRNSNPATLDGGAGAGYKAPVRIDETGAGTDEGINKCRCCLNPCT